MRAQPFGNSTGSARSALAINAAIPALRSGDAAAAEWALRAHWLSILAIRQRRLSSAGIICDQGRQAEAVQLSRQLSRFTPEAHSVRLALAQVLQKRGDPNGALEQVHALPPAVRATFEVRTFEAAVLADSERIDSKPRFTTSSCGSTRRMPLWMTFGNALRYGGRSVQALRALRRAVAIQPTLGRLRGASPT